MLSSKIAFVEVLPFLFAKKLSSFFLQIFNVAGKIFKEITLKSFEQHSINIKKLWNLCLKQ